MSEGLQGPVQKVLTLLIPKIERVDTLDVLFLCQFFSCDTFYKIKFSGTEVYKGRILTEFTIADLSLDFTM